MSRTRYSTRVRENLQKQVLDSETPVKAPAKIEASQKDNLRATNQAPALTLPRTFSQKSPVVEADLQAFLEKCMSAEAWKAYTDQEKNNIIASLPASRREAKNSAPKISIHNMTDVPPLSSGFCLGDPFLKRAIARFKRDLADGYYEKAWLNNAKQAHQERLDGKFDDYLRQHTADMFLAEDTELIEPSTEDSDNEAHSDSTYKNDSCKKCRRSN